MDKHSQEFSSIEPGARIGCCYQVLSLLGTGGMSSVYLALDTDIAQPVALKFLLEQKFDDAVAVERFKHEYSVLEALEHPNVIKGYQLIDLPNGGLCMSMEYIEGQTLTDLIRDELSDLSFEKKTDLLMQICEGLKHAHGQGIVHRDLKPENVLVTDAGVAKLVDFGIACDHTDELAATGTVGTPYYMSPEQHHGDLVDCRTDVYALGVLVYELFVGERPFKDNTAFKLLVSHVAASVPSVRKLKPELPRWMDTLIQLCMEKRPEHRFQSIDEFVEFFKHNLEKGDRPSWLSRILPW